MTKKHWIILSIIVTATILLRIIPQWDEIMVNSQVWFRGVDSYWHMRLAENMLHNFPYPQYWDWYTLYPTGGKVGFNPLTSWIISGIGQSGIDINLVGAFMPAITGGLTVVSVFFLARELFSTKVAYFACALVAVLPGEFLHRTLLGFTDHHAMETLLMTTTILFLVLMMKHNGRKLWPILSGVSLGFYLLNWSGGHLLVGILIFWFIIQILYFRMKDLPEGNYCRNMLMVFCISFAMYAPYMRYMNASLFNFAPYFVAIILPIWMWNRGNKKATLMSVLLPLGIIAIALVVSDYYRMILFDMRAVFWGGETTIQEATPSSPSVILATSGVAFFLFIAGIILYARQKQEKSILFIVWALIMLVATIGQRRWGYYFVVPMSIFASYFTFYTAKWVSANTRKIAIGIVMMFTIISVIRGTVGIVTLPNNITPDMHNTLTWLKENSPEPYHDFQGDYYSLRIYDYPHYGVLSWWDYGHWISQIAQRIPCSNPAYQDPNVGSKFFASRTEDEALVELGDLNIKYILLHEDMVGGKYYAIQQKAEKDTDLLESVILRLWNDELDSYKMIREEGKVRLYERQES